VYVIDANTGAIVKTFSTTRSVVGDVALIAVATQQWSITRMRPIPAGTSTANRLRSSVSNWVINQVVHHRFRAEIPIWPGAALSERRQCIPSSGIRRPRAPLAEPYPYGGVTNRFYVYLVIYVDHATNLDGSPCILHHSSGGSFGTTTSCSTPGFCRRYHEGRFMNLNQYGTGEQTVSKRAHRLVARWPSRPTAHRSDGGYLRHLGQALGYWVNLFNASGAIGVPGATCGGSRASVFVGGGLPSSPVMANVVVGGMSMTVTFGTAQQAGG